MAEWKQTAQWADDSGGDSWDQDTGAPTLRFFGDALQVWSFLQEKRTTVADAALAFNVPAQRIIEAVEEHTWMYLENADDDPTKQIIGHDGE